MPLYPTPTWHTSDIQWVYLTSWHLMENLLDSLKWSENRPCHWFDNWFLIWLKFPRCSNKVRTSFIFTFFITLQHNIGGPINQIFSDMINHLPLSIQPISNIWGWMNKLSILDFQLLAINQNTVQINSPGLSPSLSHRHRQTLNISHNRYLPNMTSNEPPSTFFPPQGW